LWLSVSQSWYSTSLSSTWLVCLWKVPQLCMDRLKQTETHWLYHVANDNTLQHALANRVRWAAVDLRSVCARAFKVRRHAAELCRTLQNFAELVTYGA
jgi:hypothetical protein